MGQCGICRELTCLEMLANSRSTSFLAALHALAFLEAHLELEHCSARQRRRTQKRTRDLPRLRRGKTTHCQRSRAFSSVSLGAPLYHQHLSLEAFGQAPEVAASPASGHAPPASEVEAPPTEPALAQLEELLEEVIDRLMLVRSQRRLLIHHASVPSFSLIHHLRWALSAAVIQKILRLLGRVIGCGVASAMSLGWCHAGSF